MKLNPDVKEAWIAALSTVNDDLRYDFNRIADIIRE